MSHEVMILLLDLTLKYKIYINITGKVQMALIGYGLLKYNLTQNYIFNK